MQPILNLRELYDRVSVGLESESAEKILFNIEELVKGAILDPAPEVRQGLIKTLNKLFSNVVQGGFSADNQLFLVLGSRESKRIFYVCDMPRTYLGNESKPNRFYRKN